LIPAGGEIVDIGCGSGFPIAAELIERGFGVTGVDGTPTMIALFRRNLPGVGVHLADMRELALNRRFQGLLAWDSFFHLKPDDQCRMFPRFQAHAEPRAALMLAAGPPKVKPLAASRVTTSTMAASIPTNIGDCSTWPVSR